MNDYDPKDEEVDVEPFEGDPDFEEAPWSQTANGSQDDEVSS